MIDARRMLKVFGGTALSFAAAAGHAIGYEASFDLRVVTYRPDLPRWPADLRLFAVVISDLHACEPWMPLERIDQVVAAANALVPDIVLLLGDYVTGMPHGFATRSIPPAAWAGSLARLQAPLGVHAILGNHDWLEDPHAQERGLPPTAAGEALEAVGIPVLHNRARRIETSKGGFWIAGLGDQDAFRRRHRDAWRGLDDLDATLADVTTDEPVLLLAHEPDIFIKVPSRVSLTLSGHTHGGQIRLFNRAPVVPSRFGERFAYGHVIEDGRHLIVSAGLGCSDAPVRLGVSPEIVRIEIAHPLCQNDRRDAESSFGPYG